MMMMMMSDKRSATGSAAGDSLLERLPENILNEILSKLEPETLTTLCSLACLSRTLRFSVNQTLSSFSSLDLSAFTPDPHTFGRIIPRFRKIEKITLDCLRLNDSSITSFLGPDVEELVLFKCSSLSYQVLSTIGRTCPNLRVLTLEFSGFIDQPSVFGLNLEYLLGSCGYLEVLHIKIRGEEINEYGFMLLNIYSLLPKTLKVLKLQPANAFSTINFLKKHIQGVAVSPTPFGWTLRQVSLVLDVITDVLIITIVNSLPLLAELDLKDRPTHEPLSSKDLTNLGLQSLICCRHLTSLSLIRSRQHIATSFKRTTDMGMFLLSEGCKGLESVRLGGFSKVSDAGFTAILNSCSTLKKFEIQNALLLTDLAFQDVGKVPRSLVEVKLVSCNFITSEAVKEVATSSALEILDLFGCRSVADSCLSTISYLTLLTSLNLGGADVTDSGMAVLGKGNTPISCLCLRGCKRVTDKGIGLLLGGKIGKSLLSLDLGHMPGTTDTAVVTIADSTVGLTELCIRNCFHVTDVSVKALALKGGSKLLRRLDLYNCTALSVESLELLKKPLFRGLQWIGIGRTRLIGKGDAAGLAEIKDEKQWLTIGADGCEVGCHDGWQFHKIE